MAQLQASTHTHHAPAGGRYKSLLDAGRTLIREKYPGFLQGTAHAMLPPFFVNLYPEQMGEDWKIKPGPNTVATNKQLQGASVNKLGEDLESLGNVI